MPNPPLAGAMAATPPDVIASGTTPDDAGPVSGSGPMAGAIRAGAPASLPPLHRQRDFVALWTAQSVSQFGSHVSLLALPLAAAVTLDASPAQMGLLTSAERMPFLLFGLLAGVWVDRRRRLGLMVWSD
ncbi:MAG: hypothetical protein WKF80_09580, partial [Thermomicrobiales bacterium]